MFRKFLIPVAVATLFAAYSFAPFIAIAQDDPAPTAIESSVPEQAAPDPGDIIAPPDNTWTIPYGSMIDGFAETLRSVILTVMVGILTYAMKFLPFWLQGIFRTFLTAQAEQLLARAVDYGINSVRGATKGKTLDINVGSAVVANAAEYATAKGWSYLVEWLGGVEGIKQAIFARLDLPEEATPQQMGVRAVTSLDYRENKRR